MPRKPRVTAAEAVDRLRKFIVGKETSRTRARSALADLEKHFIAPAVDLAATILEQEASLEPEDPKGNCEVALEPGAWRELVMVADQVHAASGCEPTCRRCGCTEDRACEGGCAWVDEEQTLCSACAGGEL